MKRACSIAALLATALAATAGEPVPEPAMLSLPSEAAAREALETSPQLQAAHESIAIGAAREQRQRSGPHEWEVMALAQQRTDPVGIKYDEQEYGLQRSVRWPWKYSLDRRIGEYAREVGELSYVDAWHEAGRQLLDLWFEWLEAERAVALHSGQLALLQEQQGIVARRTAAGDAAQLELQLASVETGRLQAAGADAARRAAAARASLLGLFPALSTTTPAQIGTPVDLTGTDAEWLERIVAGNHEIELADTRAAGMQVTAERAGRNRLADPSLGLRYSDNLDGNRKVVGLQFAMPIGGGARTAEAAIARSEARMAAAEAAGSRALVDAAARSAISDARLRYRAWRDLQETHVQQQLSATAATRGYELGEFGIALMLAARRSALESQLALESAQLQALRAHARVLLDAHLLWAPEHHDPEHDSGSDVSRN